MSSIAENLWVGLRLQGAFWEKAADVWAEEAETAAVVSVALVLALFRRMVDMLVKTRPAAAAERIGAIFEWRREVVRGCLASINYDCWRQGTNFQAQRRQYRKKLEKTKYGAE